MHETKNSSNAIDWFGSPPPASAIVKSLQMLFDIVCLPFHRTSYIVGVVLRLPHSEKLSSYQLSSMHGHSGSIRRNRLTPLARRTEPRREIPPAGRSASKVAPTSPAN